MSAAVTTSIGNHLQFFETVGPYSDDEAEQAEGDRGQHQKCQHPPRMKNMQRQRNRPAVARIIRPRMIDLVAAAPT